MKLWITLAASRPWLRRALPALVAGLLLVGGASGAWAEGRIAFTKMKAEECEEGGSCEWRLTCQIGRQPVQEVIPLAEVVGAGSFDINKTYDVPRFPVPLACTLWEDDGWFGTSWDEVGKANLDLPGGGDYLLEMGNKDDGAVKVHLSVDSLEIGAPPAPAPAAAPAKGPAKGKPPAPRQYIGVFEKLPGGRAVVVGLPWERFKARADQLAAKGSHPGVVETYTQGDQRLWSGIFYSGAEKSEIVTGLEWDAFAGKWKQLTDSGMRLMDLVVYSQGNKRLFFGVFHDGWDDESFWVGQNKDEFQNKWTELSSKGVRLIDLEHYRSDNGRRLYAGTFRAGEGGYGLWTELTPDAFYGKWKTASEGGLQVLDLEPYTEGGKQLFDAVLHGGQRGHVTTPVEWPALAAAWKQQLGQGLRLVDLETF